MANHPRHIEIVENFARLDVDRKRRTGIPEAVLAEGKTVEQVVAALGKLVEHTGIALATRVSDPTASAIDRELGTHYKVVQNRLGRTAVVKKHDVEPESTGGRIAVLAAGTSDLPVAEEAKVSAEVMGCEVLSFYDVGVAGIHRLIEPLKVIHEREVGVLVVVAGMEGALPSVIRGLVAIPVIGVPTSTGYGYGGKGEAALMTMLQSCAPGLTVVNIDNGFGAGSTAALIANLMAEAKRNSARP
jgi:NCAIR mutase (PurE)-related protein